MVMKMPKTQRIGPSASSPKQLSQRKLFLALGRVTGLMGFVNAAVMDVRCAEVDCNDLLYLSDRLRLALHVAEVELRKKMSELSEMKK